MLHTHINHFICRNWDVSSTGNGKQTGTVHDGSWQHLGIKGNTVGIGSIVQSSSSDLLSVTPTSILVKGIPCTLVCPIPDAVIITKTNRVFAKHGIDIEVKMFCYQQLF